MTAPHCPTCHDDVSVPHDFDCWRCEACGAVFAIWSRDEYEHEPGQYYDYENTRLEDLPF